MDENEEYSEYHLSENSLDIDNVTPDLSVMELIELFKKDIEKRELKKQS